jgi:hypothetical protein
MGPSGSSTMKAFVLFVNENRGRLRLQSAPGRIKSLQNADFSKRKLILGFQKHSYRNGPHHRRLRSLGGVSHSDHRQRSRCLGHLAAAVRPSRRSTVPADTGGSRRLHWQGHASPSARGTLIEPSGSACSAPLARSRGSSALQAGGEALIPPPAI